MKCNRCHVELEPDWKYCAICGQKTEQVSYLEAKHRLQSRFHMIVDLNPETFPISESDYKEAERQFDGFSEMIKARRRRLRND